MNQKTDNSKAIEFLEYNGITVMEFFKKDEDMFKFDTLTFLNKYTESVTEIDCIRAVQILEREGFQVIECNLRIRLIDGVVERPTGKLLLF